MSKDLRNSIFSLGSVVVIAIVCAIIFYYCASSSEVNSAQYSLVKLWAEESPSVNAVYPSLMAKGYLNHRDYLKLMNIYTTDKTNKVKAELMKGVK